MPPRPSYSVCRLTSSRSSLQAWLSPCSLTSRSGRWHAMRLARRRCRPWPLGVLGFSDSRQRACTSLCWSRAAIGCRPCGWFGVDWPSKATPGWLPPCRADQPRRRGWLARRRLACVPPACGTSPPSRYSRTQVGRSAPTGRGRGLLVGCRAGSLVRSWSLPAQSVGAAPVVVGPVVVGPLVGAMLVGHQWSWTLPRVVAVVVGPTVVDGAVTAGWVVAPTTEGAVVVVATDGGRRVGRGRSGGRGRSADGSPPRVRGGGRGRRVVGSRGAVVVDVDVGAGLVGTVGSATPGTRRGWFGLGQQGGRGHQGGQDAVVSPKTNSSNLQGRRGLARCRGAGVGMVHHPGSAGSSGFPGAPASRPLPGA